MSQIINLLKYLYRNSFNKLIREIKYRRRRKKLLKEDPYIY